MAIFDFNQFQQGLEEQRVLQNARQAEQMRTQAEQTEIKRASARLAEEYDAGMGPLRQQIQISQQKATHARQLADSNNPLDTLRLMGLQAMDPAGYRRDVRQARLAEDMQRASALGQVHGVSQQALQYQLLASATELERAQLAETIGMEKLTAIQEESALLEKNYSAAFSMQQTAILDMDSDQIRTALADAKVNGSTNVNGVDISYRALEERQQVLLDREYQNTVKAMALREKNEEVVRLAQQKELNGFNKAELLEIRRNGYKNAAGELYQPADVDQAWTRVAQAESDFVVESIQKHALENFDKTQLATEAAQIEEMRKKFKENDPIQVAFRDYDKALKLAANFADPANPLSLRLQAYEATQEARAQLDSKIAQQAKFDAKGDKGKEEMLLDFYRGSPIDIDTLRNAVQTRLTATTPRSVADLLPPEVAAVVERKYRELYQEALSANGQFGVPISSEERKIAQADAVQAALDYGINQSIQARSDSILSQQVMDPTHPLNAIWSPQQMAQAINNADTRARETIQQAFQLSPEEFVQIMAGGSVEGKPDGALIRSELAHAQNEELLIQIDGENPGLGTSVANWWMTHGQDYVQKEQSAYRSGSVVNFQQNAARDLGESKELQGMLAYGMGLAASDETAKERHAQRRAEFLTMGSNPENTQVMLLHYDKNLQGEEKRLIFENVIEPLLRDAKQRGLDYNATNKHVERGLMNVQPDSPELKSALKTMKRERGRVVEQFGDTLTLADFLGTAGFSPVIGMWNRITGQRSGVNMGMIGRPVHPGQAKIDWYLGLKQEQAAAQPNSAMIPNQ